MTYAPVLSTNANVETLPRVKFFTRRLRKDVPINCRCWTWALAIRGLTSRRCSTWKKPWHAVQCRLHFSLMRTFPACIPQYAQGSALRGAWKGSGKDVSRSDQSASGNSGSIRLLDLQWFRLVLLEAGLLHCSRSTAFSPPRCGVLALSIRKATPHSPRCPLRLHVCVPKPLVRIPRERTASVTWQPHRRHKTSLGIALNKPRPQPQTHLVGTEENPQHFALWSLGSSWRAPLAIFSTPSRFESDSSPKMESRALKFGTNQSIWYPG